MGTPLECGSGSFRFSSASRACGILFLFYFTCFRIGLAWKKEEKKKINKEEDFFRKLRLRI
jgi:hypothetical protein